MPPTAQYRMEIKGPSGSQVEKAVMDAYQQGLSQLRTEVENAFMRHARMTLKSTRQAYTDALSVVEEGEGVTVTIDGWLPVALEQGAAGFDMKPGLLKGRKSRVIPMHDGEFRTVSVNSPPESWHHPGFEPRAIHEAVEGDADKLIAKSFKPFFDRIKI